MLLKIVSATLLTLAATAAVATADHIPGHPCNCASHAEWPTINGKFRKASGSSRHFRGSRRSDELLGHHGSDTLRGADSNDILWGDWDPKNQPTTQRDTMYGGNGTDFIYGSHGRNTVYAGAGNDVISVHYGRGMVDCGPGRDIYHVARSRKKAYRFRNCEKVDYRPESVRGGPLKPLS